MCGRFTLIADSALLADHFSLPELLWYEVNIERYNIAPGQDVPVIHMVNNALRLTSMSWGLIPTWNDASRHVRPINARLETLAIKPIFKKLLHHQRCLIPASAFYEWQKDSSPRQPYYFSIHDYKIFAFAGLWNHSPTIGGGVKHSFTIITIPASSEMVAIHPRMPFILDPEYYQDWLQNPYFTLDNKRLPLPLDYHPVSRAVNAAKKDDPSLKEYVDPLGDSCQPRKS